MKIKFLTLTIVFIMSLVFGLTENISAETHGSTHWTYGGATGPAKWGDLNRLFTMCKKGRSQSPINITATERKNESQIDFHYGSSPLRLINNGHTIQNNSNSQSYIIVKGKKFNLLQFHFHSPSEHRINGRRYAMELHFVHRNSIGQLAVLGVLLKRGKENPSLNKLWDNIPYELNEEKVVGINIEAADFLPYNGSYYHYMGSLTTPPCSEGVRWYILKSPIEVSQNQIKKFTNLIRFNARPVQPLNGRVVQAVNTGRTNVIQLTASPGSDAFNKTSASSSHEDGQTYSASTSY
ncbi:MAG TPA: carbonic anhydrase family protein, partial [Spirochaetes bacterium]|nr:carbonic anhydrase family protein [Spirochaetota bacterium]